MIRLMSDCLLRISEVVAVNVGDFKGSTPTLRSSKTDQECATVVGMQVAGRWKSSQMPAYYAKAELAERQAIARFKDGSRKSQICIFRIRVVHFNEMCAF
jgi:hypothetical protein